MRILQELERNERIWEALRLRDYQVDYQRQWVMEPDLDQSITVTVRNGSIKSVVNSFNGQELPVPISYPDVGQSFEWVRDAVDREYEVINVEYHPEFGYPTNIWLAYIDAPGVGSGFTARVRPLPAISDCDNERQHNPAIGSVFSTPAVADGTLYVGSKDGYVYALDASSGSLLWCHSAAGPVSGAPIVVGEVVYASSDPNNGVRSGYVYALDVATGDEIWQRPITRGWIFPPMVVDEVVYVGSNLASIYPGGLIYALDVSTGYEQWRYEVEYGLVSSPVLGDGVVYFASREGEARHGNLRLFDFGYVYAMDASTGQLRWRYKTDFHALYSPVVIDGVVYIGSISGHVHALDAPTGEQLWRYETNTWLRSPLAVVDGVVYFSSWDGQLDALKASTGDPLWHYNRECGVFSFPVAEGGVVYVGSTDEHLYALDAFTGELRWRNAMGTSLFSSPALVEGAVYIGSPDGYVYALDASTGGSLWRSRADDHP